MNAYVDLFCQQERAQRDQSNESAASIALLSEQDRVLLRGIAAGYSQRALGQELELHPDEVKSRVDALFRKIGAQRTADAVRIAILAGL